MKKIIVAICFFLAAGIASAGQVGGGGGTAALSENDLMAIYNGSQKFSRENLGVENLFNIDIQNQIVTFDVERKIFDESPILTFEEVKEIGKPEADKPEAAPNE